MFSSRCHLKRHEKKHEIPKPHVCDICNLSFSKKSKLFAHINVIHNGALYPNLCERCGKSFKTPSKLKYHVEAVHMKIFTCGIDGCFMTFETKGELKKHNEENHEIKEEGWKCEFPGCESVLKSRRNLREHFFFMHKMSKEERDEKFRCDICGKGLSSYSALNSHKKTLHLKIKEFECEKCKKPFSTKATLQRHKLKIPECDKKITERISEGEKEKQTKIVSGGNNSCLDIISGINYLQRKIPCTTCPARFYRIYDLQRHMKAEH